MPMPSVPDCYRPVLELMAEGKGSIKELVPDISDRFGLTPEQREELLPSGSRTRIFDRVDWAHYQLFRAGFTRRVARGRYEITEAGRAVLANGPDPITQKFLLTVPAYADWKSGDRSPSEQEPPAPEAAASDAPPEEQVEEALRALDAELAEELLNRLREITPARFEQVIVDLLIAMGYGDGRADMGRAIGKSGDGGIDGIVKEDALGLDAVYVQAKRYAPENTVGRPAIQAFIGAMTGENATKGVFVTTSGFSAEARDYVRRVQQRLVLIDGGELARLMIRHEVGVRARRTFTLRSIDENYFVET